MEVIMNKRERVSIIILILLSLILSSCRAVTKPDIHSENINIYSEDEEIPPIEEKVEDKVEEMTFLLHLNM